jgi:hypothetical protein
MTEETHEALNQDWLCPARRPNETYLPNTTLVRLHLKDIQFYLSSRCKMTSEVDEGSFNVIRNKEVSESV